MIRSWAYAYRDRKQRKRQFRRLWILRINAAARFLGDHPGHGPLANALRADVIARSTSGSPARGMLARVPPVEGSTASRQAPSPAPQSSPSTSMGMAPPSPDFSMAAEWSKAGMA